MGQGDMETRRQQSPPGWCPRGHALLRGCSPRGKYGAAMGYFGKPTLPPGCHGPCPTIPAAPRTPAWPPLALQAAVGCACVALNPPNYSEPGGLGGEIKSRMGEKVHFLLCHAGLMG